MTKNDKLQIKTCPTCGSDRIVRVKRDLARKYKGQTYIIPAVEFFDCPNCGEKVFDHDAMLKIEAYSPAYQNVELQELSPVLAELSSYPDPAIAGQAGYFAQELARRA